MIQLVLLSGFAGLMIPLGGWIAAHENIQRDWLRQEIRHSVIAFGGGALLSAVMLVLIPEGKENQSVTVVITLVLAGAVLMALIDARLDRTGSSKAQSIAMLADFLPETLALGAVLALGGDSAILLALMIGLQNLPEGFNAYREQAEHEGDKAIVLRRFLGLAMLGPVAASFGYFVLFAVPVATSGIMLLAAGAILYLTFQDIAPQARLQKHYAPPLGAIAGFLLGLYGSMVIN